MNGLDVVGWDAHPAGSIVLKFVVDFGAVSRSQRRHQIDVVVVVLVISLDRNVVGLMQILLRLLLSHGIVVVVDQLEGARQAQMRLIVDGANVVHLGVLEHGV